MRSSIDAQSWASVPPEPAWMSMKQLLASSGLENMRRNSSAATSFASLSTSEEIPSSVASSLSALASWNSSAASVSPLSRRASMATTDSSCFFSLPSSCARCGFSHSLASSNSRLSASRRFFFASKSKIPPQLRRPRLQVGEARGHLVQSFGFHGRLFYGLGRVFLGDLVVEEAGRVRRRHEAPVHLGINADVLIDLAVRHLDLQR